MNVDLLIQEHYHALTKSEKKVADFVILAKEKVIYSTMQDLKTATKVGDATIIRFCQKLGFNGFSDLKIEIAKEDFSQHTTGNNEINFYTKTTEKIKNVLSMTNQLLEKDNIDRAVKMITEAKTIYIFGVGSSGNTGNDLEAMFLRVGVKAHSIVDPHFQSQIASLLTDKDCVIGLSLSGKTKDVHDSLAIAKKNQTKIIAITNHLLSPIGKLGDIVLQTPIEEFLNGASIEGKLSQLYICDVLIQSYEQENNIDTLKLRETVLRSILDKSID